MNYECVRKCVYVRTRVCKRLGFFIALGQWSRCVAHLSSTQEQQALTATKAAFQSVLLNTVQVRLSKLPILHALSTWPLKIEDFSISRIKHPREAGNTVHKDFTVTLNQVVMQSQTGNLSIPLNVIKQINYWCDVFRTAGCVILKLFWDVEAGRRVHLSSTIILLSIEGKFNHI